MLRVTQFLMVSTIAALPFSAFADVSMSGYARFGLKYVENNPKNSAEETFVTSRYRINLDTSTVTDAGVTLGARIRLQAEDAKDGTAKPGAFNGARFQVSTDALRVRVGNIAGAFDDSPVLNISGNEPGLTAFTSQNATFGAPYMSYSSSGAGANGISAVYSINGLSLMAAMTANNGSTDYGDQYELGIGYEFGDWQVGAAFGKAEAGTKPENEFWAVAAEGSLGVADVTVFVGDDDATQNTAYGISAAFKAGAATKVLVSAAGGGTADQPGKEVSYGIGVKHDLGGGASLRGGVGQDTDGNTVADFGARFDF